MGYRRQMLPRASSNGHTEEGRRLQASLSVREILDRMGGRLPLAVWYDLRDDDGPSPRIPLPPTMVFSIRNGNAKPAIKAIQTLMGVVSGRKHAGMLLETPAGIHAMRMDGATDTILTRPISRMATGLSSTQQVVSNLIDGFDGAARQSEGTCTPAKRGWK